MAMVKLLLWVIAIAANPGEIAPDSDSSVAQSTLRPKGMRQRDILSQGMSLLTS